jgi:hypothetical protein
MIDPLAKRKPYLSKPLVVAVHGDTWNMADELFLVADARVAAANTNFGQDENTHGRLHAGCRSGSLRSFPKLIPEDESASGFDIVYSDFDTSSAVRLRSPLSILPAGILYRFFRNASSLQRW